MLSFWEFPIFLKTGYWVVVVDIIIVSDYLSEIGNHLLDSLLLSFEKKLQQRGDSLSAWTNICNCRKSTKYKERGYPP